MASFISPSSSSSPLHLTMSHISTPSSSAPFDDGSEDACSICLEPFSTDDPSTALIPCLKSNHGTMLYVWMSCELQAVKCQKEVFAVRRHCKHEYHLHCILEWSQRSKECPVCWQLLILKDPASQELLNAVEAEKRLSSRTVYSHAFTNPRGPLQQVNNDHDDSCSDDSDFDEQLMQHLVTAANRARYICRRERQRSPGAGPSEVLVFNSSMHASGMLPTLTTSSSGGSSPTSNVPFAANNQPPISAFSSVGMVTTNTSSESDMRSKPRVIYSQPSPESARRLNTSDLFSFPESIKSKLSAASARCKESISKNTRGLKEKLIARNTSVKELSKGVQREMNAGFAGVARMIERLDLTSKRSSSTLIPVKGKSVQENDGNGQFPNEESGVFVGDVTSNASSLDSSLVAVGVEIPSCVQSGHDAVRS